MNKRCCWDTRIILLLNSVSIMVTVIISAPKEKQMIEDAVYSLVVHRD